MSVQDSSLNLDDEEEEPEDLTVRRLVRAIDYAEGFWLGLAKSNTPAQRRRLAALCRDLLEPLKISVLEIELTEPVTDLLPILRERLAQERAATGRDTQPIEAPAPTSATSTPNQPKLAIFVHGLEHSIPSRESYPPLLSSLNLNRELFLQQVPIPLLLWLPDYALTALARKAPDFWAWRSGLYEFAPERDLAEQSLEAISGEAVHITGSLSERDKRARVIMLKGLLDDYCELGDGTREKEARAHILYELGLMYERLGEWLEAKRAFEEALSISRQLEDKEGESVSLHQLGILAKSTGDYDEANHLYDKSLKLAKEIGDRSGIAKSLGELATNALLQGNLIEAQQLYNECLKLLEEIADQHGISITRHQLAMIEFQQGNYAEAHRLFNESLKIKRRLGDKDGIALVHWGLGNVFMEEGDLDTASELFNKALQSLNNLGDRVNAAGVLHQLGRVAQAQGEIEKARNFYNESLKIMRGLGNQQGIATAFHQLGRLAENQGDKLEAARLFREALNIFDRLRSPNVAIARRSLGRVEDRENDSE